MVKKLSEIASIFSGFAFKSVDLQSTGIPVIKIANIQNKKVVRECIDFLPESMLSSKLEKYLLTNDDTLVAMTGAGSVGKVGKMNPLNGQYLVNQRVAIVRVNREMADPDYVYYVLIDDRYESTLYGYGLGAGQPNVSPALIGSLELPWKPLVAQHRIASIPSAYDDLIENNTRRIKILEEMSQAIYRDWFVEFRVPGVEMRKATPEEQDVTGKNMFPKGWTTKSLAEVCEIKYGKMMSLKNVSLSGKFPVYGAGDIIGFCDHCLIEEKVTLITCRGNGSGTVWRTREPAFITNNSLLVLPSYDKQYWRFQFIELLLRHSNVMGVRSGSAQPQITIEGLSTVRVITPAEKVVKSFCLITEPLYQMIDILFKMKTGLRRTRDLLLPKLVSGEVSVENIFVESKG